TAELSLIENIQREDLNPIEEASAYKSLIEEHSLTQEDLSRIIGKSRPAIANSLRLLDLPENIRSLVVSGRISQGHARALLGLKNPDNMKPAADAVVASDLSVRQTEDLVRKLNNKRETTDIPVKTYNTGLTVDYTKALEEKIRSKIGRNVHVVQGKKINKIEIEYTDNNDLENLLIMICGKSITED
ncbi:MAG: ParB/RepB/Spo0J family partition protein, partial [Clostridia bacterium]|nr:ParB/RepB/Spo0J family partition protein [Clostridia bacterium]